MSQRKIVKGAAKTKQAKNVPASQKNLIPPPPTPIGDVLVGNNIDDGNSSIASKNGTDNSGFQSSRGDSATRLKNSEKHYEERTIIKNLWEVCCNETEKEIREVNAVLKLIGLPSVHYSKKKVYDITDYDAAPDLQTCKTKDFLDFHVFPYVLPAIQALIQFARRNRIFQSRFYTFNALDYLVEYLYNNNPRYPARAHNPTPIFEIPFCKEWLKEHPRPPPPRWMVMASEEAAVIIQRVIRGYMVRCKPAVQEMRQFWKEFRRDREEENAIYKLDQRLSEQAAQLGAELYGEVAVLGDHSQSPPEIPEILIPTSPRHHSENCVHCQAFRNFLATQPDDVIKSYTKKVVSIEIVEELTSTTKTDPSAADIEVKESVTFESSYEPETTESDRSRHSTLKKGKKTIK